MKKALIVLILITILGSKIESQIVTIIPAPQKILVEEDVFILNSRTTIVSEIDDAIQTANVLQKNIHFMQGLNLVVDTKGKKNSSSIFFMQNKKLANEEYSLVVSTGKVEISASSSTGWFYGVQSLMQLFPQLTPNTQETVMIPQVSISDKPRFPWRAFMLDESRHFKGMDQVKMLLDEMALLKMNVFHWHLVDDQGWRIEIKKYPLLTEVGSKRKSTQVGPKKWKSPIETAEPHSGFYTQEEIKEIVRYAQERHINIVPEIEMPGHSSAAIAAYPWLGTTNDTIEVPTRFGIESEVYDVSDPKVYQFLTDVLDEVMTLFPSNVIHIGGDEVRYNHWKESSTVQAYMRERNLATPADLQVFFTNNISQYIQSKGKRMMGWNEIMGHKLHAYQDAKDLQSSQQLAKESVIHFWKGDVALLTEAASNGYDIVNSQHSSTYLDYNYNSIPLSKAYSFDPIPHTLDSKYHNRIIGVGCQMWSEWIPTNGEMHYMVFPRIAAYAEVGWTSSENKDFDYFKIGLKKLQDHWRSRGIYYAEDEYIEEQKI